MGSVSVSYIHNSVIQKSFVEVCLWQALLVACLKFSPLFFYSNRTQIPFGAAAFTAPGTTS